MVFFFVFKMNLFFIYYFLVSVVVFNMVWVEVYNSIVLMVYWIVVFNIRDSMKGRFRGYKVNDCLLFLLMYISKGFINYMFFKILVV